MRALAGFAEALPAPSTEQRSGLLRGAGEIGARAFGCDLWDMDLAPPRSLFCDVESPIAPTSGPEIEIIALNDRGANSRRAA